MRQVIWVRKVIHEFNDVGLEALVSAWGGGRPKTITEEIRARIVAIVDSRPQELGEPYTTGRCRTCVPISAARS
jgi:hypothetical protein